MNNKKNTQFLFVGNGSYENRGCEAIVRGTMEILRHEFGEPLQVSAGVFAEKAEIQKQNVKEIDPAILSHSISGVGPRLSLKWWAGQANNRLGARFEPQHWGMKSLIQNARAALEVGGDNYSLDYGRPKNFMAMDRFLQKQGLPVVLWGASVGPFDKDLEFAPRMFDHLRSLSAIFVRETASLEYLRSNGVSDNVHLVADPAFVMKAVKPPNSKFSFSLHQGTIGINLSPLVARFRDSSKSATALTEWLDYCCNLIKAAATLKRPILLIPHVGSADPDNDDFSFLGSLCKVVAPEVGVPVNVLPRGLSAAELKWIIARCEIFAGARTHATIAALSSGVPTLSIGYSLKARGLNQDIFGNLNNCISVTDLNATNFTERLKSILGTQENIRTHLADCIPDIKNKALSAGSLLRKVLENKK
jgi:polysaccharide pyruvyl transferase WcaK-like protein